jgi:integrase
MTNVVSNRVSDRRRASGTHRAHGSAILTDGAIRRYTPGKERRRIRDLKSQSLYLVIEPSGTKSFEMRFRRPDGRPAKIRLGKYSELEVEGAPVLGQRMLTLAAARQLTQDVHRRRALGEDVIGEVRAERQRRRSATEQRAAHTFSACLREFLVEHKVKKRATRPRRWRETARVLGLDYPPGAEPSSEPRVIKGGLADIWRDRPVTDIDHELIFGTIRDAGRRGIPGLGRRNRGNSDARRRSLHSALSAFFAWLKRERKIASNPCAEMDRPPPAADRDRVLTESEIQWLWKATDQKGTFATIFRTLLLSGARLNEVAGMRWSELSEDGAIWTIPANRTKNARAHVVPLSPLLRELIASVKRKAGVDLIFSSTGETAPSGWSRAKRRLDAAMLALARQEGTDTIEAFRLHDLRRTAATSMADIGIQPHIIEAVLNHVSGHKGGVAGIYNRAQYASEKKIALERWASHVSGLVNGTANVIALHRQGGAA